MALASVQQRYRVCLDPQTGSAWAGEAVLCSAQLQQERLCPDPHICDGNARPRGVHGETEGWDRVPELPQPSWGEGSCSREDPPSPHLCPPSQTRASGAPGAPGAPVASPVAAVSACAGANPSTWPVTSSAVAPGPSPRAATRLPAQVTPHPGAAQCPSRLWFRLVPGFWVPRGWWAPGAGCGTNLAPLSFHPGHVLTQCPLPGEKCEDRGKAYAPTCANRCPRTCADLWDHVECLQGPCKPGTPILSPNSHSVPLHAQGSDIPHCALPCRVPVPRGAAPAGWGVRACG